MSEQSSSIDCGQQRGPPSALPDWLEGVDAAIWITGVTGELLHLNAQARALLDLPDDRWPSRDCWKVVRGQAVSGQVHCAPSCELRERVARGEALSPFCLLRPVGAGPGQGLLVVPIGLQPPGSSEPRVLHLAVDLQGSHRLRAYAEALVGDDSAPRGEARRPSELLSPRELEVLQHLASAEDQKQVARLLSISYVTVRNHVRRLLAKLGAHSIQEAVAIYLLYEA